MIIPVRCITCGKVIGDKWYTYLDKVNEKKFMNKEVNDDNIIFIKNDNVNKTTEGNVLDELGMTRYCCRRMFLSNADIIDQI